MAIWAPFAGVLCPGDYLSPVEIPMVEDSASATTWRRCGAWRRTSSRPSGSSAGTAGRSRRQRALAILREDVAYLEALRPIRRRRRCRSRGGRPPARDPRGEREAMLQHVAVGIRPRTGTPRSASGSCSVSRRSSRRGLAGTARWVRRGADAIHLQFTDEPVIPPVGHVAIVADDYQAVLRTAGGDRGRRRGPDPALGVRALLPTDSGRPSGRADGG